MLKKDEAFSGCQQRLHDEAVAATGFDDFGGQQYLEGLSVLLKAYDDTAQLGETGRYATYANLVNCLKGRLYTQHGISQRPELMNSSIKKPLIIVGLPRTGTTVLHRLLTQDSASQGLEYWLGSYPMVRPERAQWQQQTTFQEVFNSLKMLEEINPEIKAIHEMSADGVDECRLLLMHGFANVTFQSNATVPAYEEWLYQADFSSVYQYYSSCLKLIGGNEQNKHWVLKDPSHLWSMDTLLETFPDACIVQTHRDPVKLIASVSSLVLTAKKMQEPGTTAASVGLQQLEQWARVLEKTMAVRERSPERFIDVYFEDFLRDPLAIVDRIYQHMGKPLDEGTLRNMNAWMKANPQGKHGVHHYQSQDFGLTESHIRDRFENYLSFFKL